MTLWARTPGLYCVLQHGDTSSGPVPRLGMSITRHRVTRIRGEYRPPRMCPLPLPMPNALPLLSIVQEPHHYPIPCPFLSSLHFAIAPLRSILNHRTQPALFNSTQPVSYPCPAFDSFPVSFKVELSASSTSKARTLITLRKETNVE